MALRRNLVPNPACKVDASGWSGPSGWVRSTTVGAALPRTTGFEADGGGSVGGDIVTPRAQVVAGQSYVWSISIRADEGDLTGEFLVNYYAAAVGGSFVGNSGTTVPFSLTLGQTARFTVGPYTVPAGAVSGYLKINDISRGAEITAYQVESAATAGDYFDGDTLGASWDGTNGSSTSTIRQITDTFAVDDGFSVLATPVGPVTSDVANLGESFSIAASSTITDAIEVRDSFLIAALEHDEELGRNRVEAFTFAPTVVRVRVSRRIAASGSRWDVVRGGVVLVLEGFMVRPVDDYEYPPSEAVEYLIEGLANMIGDDVVVQSATVSQTAPLEVVWLKFLSAPALNRRLSLLGWSDVERSARTATYDVQGRSDPVVVSDVHSSRRLTLTVKAETPAEREALDSALSEGLPCFFQVPASVPLPSLYAVIGDYRWRTPTLRSRRAIFEIPLTEVAAPDPTISAAFATWQSTLDKYATWEQLAAGPTSWRGVAA